jgi:hypothetical protein
LQAVPFFGLCCRSGHSSMWGCRGARPNDRILGAICLELPHADHNPLHHARQTSPLPSLQPWATRYRRSSRACSSRRLRSGRRSSRSSSQLSRTGVRTETLTSNSSTDSDSTLPHGAEDHRGGPPLGRPRMQCLHGRPDGEAGADKGPAPQRRRHSRRRRCERILRAVRPTDFGQGRQGNGRGQGHQVRSAATTDAQPC